MSSDITNLVSAGNICEGNARWPTLVTRDNAMGEGNPKSSTSFCPSSHFHFLQRSAIQEKELAVKTEIKTQRNQLNANFHPVRTQEQSKKRE